MKTKWIIGTRGSKLALTQTALVADALERSHPDCRFFVKTIKTTGDTIWDKPMHLIGTKGLFVKEIEDELLSGEIDLAVHSMKDVPTELAPGLVISAVLKREDPRDVLISDTVKSFHDLTEGAKVGTNSLRRKAQILHANGSLQVVPLRGNVDTRMRKMRELGLDAIILACAGVRRMGLEERISEILPLDLMVPSAGQGAIAIETRGEPESLKIVGPLNDGKTSLEVSIERRLQTAIGGSCQVPLGIHAVTEGDVLTLYVAFGREEGEMLLRESWKGEVAGADSLVSHVLAKLKTV